MSNIPALEQEDKADECASDSFFRVIEKRNRAIGTQRIGDLNKLFAYRYRSTREDYVLPDDDDGSENLKILLDHYALNNPLAIPRIIKRRAPWADSQTLQDELNAYGPRRYKAETLGKLLGFTGAEWRRLRLRTIAPIDVTKKERRAFCRRLANEITRAKLGRTTRDQYLAAHGLTRAAPWKALSMSRATWYRRGKPMPNETVRQVGGNKVSMQRHTCLNRGGALSLRKGLGEQGRRQPAAAKPVEYKSNKQIKPIMLLQGMVEPPALSHACKPDPGIVPGGVRDRALQAVYARRWDSKSVPTLSLAEIREALGYRQ